MRPAVVLPFVLVAVIALLAVLFTGGDADAPLGPSTVDEVEDTTPSDADLARDTGPVALESGPATEGDEAAAAQRRSIAPDIEDVASEDASSNIEITVVDPDGVLLQGARIALVKRPPGSELAPFLGQARNGNASLNLNDEDLAGTTNATGVFTFDRLTPSPFWSITVRHADYADQEIRNISVSAGRTQTVKVTMAEGVMVHGYIRDEGGKPIENAQLVLIPIAALNMATPQQIEMGKATKSNSDGYYAIRNVDLGMTNTLIAHRAGYGRTARTDLRQEGADTSLEVDFRLIPGLSIRGRVLSSTGEAIAGARIDAYGFVSIQNSRASATSKSDGSFELIDLVDGPYQIRAHVQGWSEVREPRVEAGEQNLLLEMQPQCEVSGRVVVASTNGPVGDFALSIRRVTPGNQAMSPPFMTKAFNRVEDGQFTLKGVPEGTYVIQAEATGYAPSLSNSFESAPGQVVSGIEIRMSTGGGITGRVVDGATGEPIAGARVETEDSGFQRNPLVDLFGAALSRRTTSRSAVTAEDGTFTLTQLMEGDYQLRFSHPSYTVSVIRDLGVAESEEPLDYGDFMLEVGGSITGVVYDENGAALAGATVGMASTDNPGVAHQARTDAEGRYVIQHLAEGRYSIHAMRPSGQGANPFLGLLDQQRSQRDVYIENGVEVIFELSLAE